MAARAEATTLLSPRPELASSALGSNHFESLPDRQTNLLDFSLFFGDRTFWWNLIGIRVFVGGGARRVCHWGLFLTSVNFSFVYGREYCLPLHTSALACLPFTRSLTPRRQTQTSLPREAVERDYSPQPSPVNSDESDLPPTRHPPLRSVLYSTHAPPSSPSDSLAVQDSSNRFALNGLNWGGPKFSTRPRSQRSEPGLNRLPKGDGGPPREGRVHERETVRFLHEAHGRRGLRSQAGDRASQVLVATNDLRTVTGAGRRRRPRSTS